MTKIFCITAFFMISLASFSQTNDSVSEGTDTSNIPGPIFSKAEKMPEIIGGIKALEDTLLNNFSNSNPDTKIKNLLYKLIITKQGSVGACSIVGSVKNKAFAKHLERLLRQTSGMWEPAVQNGNSVAAIKFIQIGFVDGKFHVKEVE